ncbi:E3 ubiquitin-protein ligase complex slx8-rfp subunit slx8 isoform X2 [Manihot esculenta]|uniref:Uncharacterized protein n=1 Tax=Manihot esculenta TaxID=3983 RepID=A0ACB7GAQ7_MANES|nr:E3 ubiquitin-protein ligase complex slx8-rfp subunit slx8 isoform X2 [Manihot esculenta]KAG8636899.1 hypothetical protein MANES_15G055800v8 [Manihot esculenta]
MDSWGLNCLEGNMTNSQRRTLDLDLDLNYPLPPPMRALDLSLGLSIHSSSQEVQTQMRGWSHHQTTNVIRAIDDEVTIISPRTFSQARENSERNHSHGMHEVIVEDTVTVRETAMTSLCTDCKRRLSDGCDPYLKPGTSSKKKSVPMPDEPTFSCPICMSPFTEPTATRCGHIFCKECLLKSLKSLHNKCPTCRQKVGKRGIFRIYLPSTN